MSGKIEAGDLFNPAKQDSKLTAAASGLLLAMLIASIMVLLVVFNLYSDLADVRGVVKGVFPFIDRERVAATYNWVGGAPGAATGFMSETSDTLLSNAGGKRQGQSVVIGRERLVPGNNTWPSPTESVPLTYEFSSSPCNLPTVSNANANAGSLGVGRRPTAAAGGAERLSAVWKNSNERMTAGGSGNTGGYTANRNSMRGREAMKDESSLMDVLHGM